MAKTTAMAPQEMWRRAVAPRRQYLLVGDMEHGNSFIVNALAQAFPVLAAAGFRHVGLEQDPKEHQGPLDAFQFASRSKKNAGQDMAALSEYANSYAISTALISRQHMLADCQARLSFIQQARQHGLRLHCLNPLKSFETYLEECGEQEVPKFMRFANYAFRHLAAPPRISASNLLKLDGYMEGYMAYNMAQDPQCAHALQQVAGGQRAALFFGAAHFRREDGAGIEQSLPTGSSVLVVVGPAECVAQRLAQKNPVTWPDFALETDSGRAMRVHRPL